MPTSVPRGDHIVIYIMHSLVTEASTVCDDATKTPVVRRVIEHRIVEYRLLDDQIERVGVPEQAGPGD